MIRRLTRRGRVTVPVALLGGALTTLALAVPADAASHPSGTPRSTPKPKPTAAVSLGDSYISGVGGRWRGNSADATGSRQGTDRAFVRRTGEYDPTRVYGSSYANGCLRADVAEIRSARLRVRKAINLACGGATTANVLRARSGGVAFKGEAPQNDQLAKVARKNDVELIVLSIGGNDLGFAEIVGACVGAYLFGNPACSQLQPTLEQRLPLVGDAVGATLDDVHATMRAAGYRRGSYRLVLQSYPRPSPRRAAAGRYPGEERKTVGGCPFSDADVDWTSGWLTPALTRTLRGAAEQHGAQFLDLSNAFNGHELCSKKAQQSDGSPTGAESEWVRFIDLAGTQGGSGESIHPNAYGHQVMGRCLRLATYTRRDVSCHGVPGHSSRWVYVTPLHRMS